jgi:hypothetical protein
MPAFAVQPAHPCCHFVHDNVAELLVAEQKILAPTQEHVGVIAFDIEGLDDSSPENRIAQFAQGGEFEEHGHWNIEHDEGGVLGAVGDLMRDHAPEYGEAACRQCEHAAIKPIGHAAGENEVQLDLAVHALHPHRVAYTELVVAKYHNRIATIHIGVNRHAFVVIAVRHDDRFAGQDLRNPE